jgi:hypothetical protein
MVVLEGILQVHQVEVLVEGVMVEETTVMTGTQETQAVVVKLHLQIQLLQPLRPLLHCVMQVNLNVAQ